MHLDLAALLALLAARCRDVPLPPPTLEGWQSLCAEEYRDAVGRLAAELQRAADSATDAARLLLAAQ